MNQKSFSLILPTFSAYKELKLCLKSLEKNSLLENELIVIVDVDKEGNPNKNILNLLYSKGIKFFLNKKNLGPYKSWNKGAKRAERKALCFITDDQFFAHGWDLELIKHLKKKLIVTGQLVEPGVLMPSYPTIVKDFGERAENFQKTKFLNFAEQLKKTKLVNGGFFIPLAIFKNSFFKLGMFPTGGKFGIKSEPNDVLFIEKAKKQGYKFKSSLSSISYHFQASSWETRKSLRKWKNKIKMILKKL